MTTGEESTTKPVLARSLPALSCTPPQTQRAPMRGTQTATTPHSSRIERHTVRGFRRRAHEPHATRTTQPSVSHHLISSNDLLHFFFCVAVATLSAILLVCNSLFSFSQKFNAPPRNQRKSSGAPEGTEDSKDFVRTRPHPTVYFH